MFAWIESAWYEMFLGAALKGTIVLGAAWLLSWAIRKRSAAARHLVWTAAAAALLALPLLSVSLPALRLPTDTILPLAPSLTFQSTSQASANVPAPAAVRLSPAGPATPAPHRPDLRLILMLLWAAGTLLALARILFACAAMRRIRRAARPFPAAEQLCSSMAGVLGIRERVELLELPRGSMPMNFGLLRSAIFLPVDAREWTDERLRMVLLHELAHVRRGDVATHLLVRSALCLFWWHPLAWSAWREFLKERERAADDLVLAAGERASDYAGHLLEVARAMQPAPAGGWAAIAMACRSQLEGRLLAILDSRIDRSPLGRASAVAAALLAVALVAPMAALQTQQANPVIPDIDATIQAALAQKNHEILDQAAQTYENLRKYAEAQKLLESALAIRGDVSGEQSSSYAAGLFKLGDVARKSNQLAVAERSYTKALGLSPADAPDAAPALLFLGTRALGRKDYLQAETFIQRAFDAAPTGPSAGLALTWKGNLFLAQDLPGLAESMYMQALGLNHPGSPEAASTLETYAQFLKNQSRTAEAEAMTGRATAIRTARVAAMSPKRNDALQATRVGGGTTAPVLLSKVEPQYTEEARLAKLQGTAVLYVEIGVDGKAYNMKLLRSVGLGLDENAVEAVTQWTFKPGTKDGVPVPVQATIEVNFRLL